MSVFPAVRPAVSPAVRGAFEQSYGGGAVALIKSLFAQGQQGFWFPFTDFASLTQDSAGTLPYTALEQPVGRVLDRSGRGNHATQVTSTARGVVSARVNQYLESEDVVGSKWTKLNSTAAVATSPFVGAGVTKITSAVGTAITGFGYSSVLSGVMRWELTVKADGGARYLVAAINTFAQYSFTFDLQAGTISQLPTLGVSTATITASSDGFWHIVVFFENISNVLPRWLLAASPTGNSVSTTFVGDGVKAILVAKPQTSMVLEANRYQRVNTATDYDSVGFPKFLRVEVDDFYTCGGGGSTTGFYYSDVIRPMGGAGTRRVIWSDRSGNNGYELAINASDKLEFSAGNGTTITTVASTVSATVAEGKRYEVMDDGTNLSVQIDGSAPVTIARPVVTAGSSTITLYRGASTGYFNGQITEPIYRAGPPPNAHEREVIRNYQMQKAGML